MSLTSYRAAPPRVNVVTCYSYFAFLRQPFVFPLLFQAFPTIFLVWVFELLQSTWQIFAASLVHG